MDTLKATRGGSKTPNETYEMNYIPYMEKRGELPKYHFYNETPLIKIPLLKRYIYAGVEGSGRPISLGLAFSFSRKTGVVVITLPMLEVSLGYTNLSWTL